MFECCIDKTLFTWIYCWRQWLTSTVRFTWYPSLWCFTTDFGTLFLNAECNNMSLNSYFNWCTENCRKHQLCPVLLHIFQCLFLTCLFNMINFSLYSPATFKQFIKDKPGTGHQLQNKHEISTGLEIQQLNTTYTLCSVIILCTLDTWHTGQETQLFM